MNVEGSNVLKKIIPILLCPVCKDKTSQLKAHIFDGDDQQRIRDGALECKQCRAWFPIRDYVLELIDRSLIDAGTALMVADKFSRQVSDVGLSLTKMGLGMKAEPDNIDYSEQLAQREHFDWYADHPNADYADYAEMPFWSAVDAVTYDYWAKFIPDSGFFLDIGCANGRSAFPLISSDRIVVGFDISRAMVVKGMQEIESKGAADKAAFFVADGSTLPFKDNIFECVQTYGVLHHLPDPGNVISEAQRVLKPGGIHLGSENNKTAFRPIFDWMMKFVPLWHEEAGEEPLISHAMLNDWLKDINVVKTVQTSVFIPPHLCNLVGHKFATVFVRISDQLFHSVPWIKKNGGLIVFEIRKPS